MSEAAGSKRSSEGGNNWNGGGGGKKPRGGGGDSITLRFLLRSKHAGGIIGKGGETIKRLRSDFNATVTVPDTQTNERVLSIGADKDDCIKVLRECLPLVHEPPYPVNAGPAGRNGQQGGEVKETNEYEIDFLVHSSQVGGIIGRAGARIKEIREQTNAQVKVYQECLADSTERVVAVGGTEDHLIAAVEQMLEVMQEQPIKGNITLYDPSYDHGGGGGGFDNGYDGYNNNFNGPPRGGGGGMGMRGGGMRGGRGGGMRGGGMGGPPGGRNGGGPHGGGFGPQGGYGGGGGNMGGGDFTNNFGGGGGGGGDYNNFNNSQGQDQMFGGNNGGGGGGGGGNFNGGSNNNNGGGNFGGGGGGGNNNGTGMPQTTTQVTVPNDMAGAIIGKGGERIRNIRQKCGADIKFSDSDPVKKDRLITISGSQDQIQYAQYLMQQCVRQNYHT